MALGWCTVVLLVLVTVVQHGLAAEEPGADQDVPYLQEVQLIKIHMPLTSWDRCSDPCPAPDEATPTPDDINVMINGDAETTTVYPTNEIVIPDVATVEVFFTNGSMIDKVVSSFGFGGVYEVVVNRTERSVEVILDLLEETAVESEEPREPVDLVVRGPNIIGADGIDDDVDNDDDADDEFAMNDEYKKYNTDPEWKKNSDDDDDDSMDMMNEDGTKTRLKGRSRWRKGGSHGHKGHHRHHSGHRRRSHPIYINGTALSGNQLCDIAFNVSGLFLLNRTISEKTTTVVITQLISTAELGTPTVNLLRGTAESMIGTSGGVAMSTILIVVAVSALMVLLAAIIVTVIRNSRRRSAIVQAGNRGYGTISPESANETWRYFSDTFP